jgi:uncharacterized membrane protein
MSLDITIPFWILTLSQWLHLLSTVVWLGGLTLMALVAWPAVRKHVLGAGQWAQLQQRFTPWANLSIVVLWITGFLQMSADTNYEGFLNFSTLWAQAILIKHLAVIGMMFFGLYLQWRVQPALARLTLLEKKQPELAGEERERLAQRENRLVVLSLVCAAIVLFCTAIATAI